MIEDMAINACCKDKLKDEDVSQEFDWRGWKIARLKQVIKDRLNGKDTWKTKVREVVKQKVQFYMADENELTFRVVETTRA
jgi:hypothetical protein